MGLDTQNHSLSGCLLPTYEFIPFREHWNRLISPVDKRASVDLRQALLESTRKPFMSELTPDLVRHLASLARIQVTDEEAERLAAQLAVIVDSVATVNKAVEGDVPATSHPIPMANVFREDIVEPSLTQEQALSGAADSDQGRFRVAAILDEE